MPERCFLLLQWLLGLLLAGAGGCCILFLGNSSEKFNSFGLAGAFVVCGGLPPLLRRRVERPMPWLHRAMIAGLIGMLLIYAAIRLI